VPLGRGITLARNSDTGDCTYSNKRVGVGFYVEDGARRIKVRWDKFDGVPLHADLRFSLPADHESTVIVTPIQGDRFYYNRKVNSMPVEGTLRIGDETTVMSPESSLGNLDWGRGVWEYNSFWVWASASGFLGDGRRVGLNMGRGFGDTSAATENTLLLDGRIHKLGDVAIDYEASDFMRPWQMRSERVDLVFTPFVERVAETKLVVIDSEVHQMFGRYVGSIVADEMARALRSKGSSGGRRSTTPGGDYRLALRLQRRMMTAPERGVTVMPSSVCSISPFPQTNSGSSVGTSMARRKEGSVMRRNRTRPAASMERTAASDGSKRTSHGLRSPETP